MIEPLGAEQARFVHRYRTTGPLAPILGGWSAQEQRGQLEAMNLALKGRVKHGSLSYSAADDDAIE